jgi:hypothetical protein
MVRLATKERTPAIRVDHQPGEIDRTLALAFRLLEAVETFVAALAFSELGDFEFTFPIGSEADQASLRALAPLYLASELEAARLLPAVEMLTGIYVSGGLPGDLGPAAGLVTNFWKKRKDRFTAVERQAFFSRLFGSTFDTNMAGEGGRNVEFEPLMINLTEALYKLDESSGFGRNAAPFEETRLRMAASALADNLIPRSGGITAFASRDILEAVQQALAILKYVEVQRAMGAHSLWSAVRNIAENYLNETGEISAHVTRGQSGVLILAWLAEVLPQLHNVSGSLAAFNDPVLTAATAWLQASLTLEEERSEIAPAGNLPQYA